MAKIFNIKATGDFLDPGTLTRPLSTTNANSEIGIDTVAINGRVNLPNEILSEGLPLKGIFLNIDRVTNNANSLLSILLSTINDTYTTTYYTSALYKGRLNNSIISKSQYWQGFELDSITIPNTDSFVVGISCSSLTDIDILSDSTLGFNRYIIPENAAEVIDNSISPSICIGSYIPSIESAAETKTSSITANVNLSCEDINIWSKSTLVLSTLNVEISGNIIVATDGNLTITPNTTALLFNNACIVSINTATISAIGDYKQPYAYLTTDTAINDIDCSVDSAINWNIGDFLFFPSNTSINTFEILPITSVASNIIGIENNFNNIHYSKQYFPLNIFNNTFNGSPICNFTRSVLISAQSASSFIYADNNSSLILHNVELRELTYPEYGSIVVSNTNTSISGCTITYNIIGGPAGILVATDQATNFNITNNFIYNCTDGIKTFGSPTIPLPFVYSVNKNVIANSTDNGIKADYTHYIEYNDNIIIDSASDGISVNKATSQSTNIYQISGNYCFNCKGAGISITNSDGTIQGNTLLCNERGLEYISSNIEHDIRLISISAGYNAYEGISLHNSKIYTEDILSLNNSTGILYDGVYGATLHLTVTGNTTCGASVNNCNVSNFELSGVNITYNKDNLKYAYPSQAGWNFFPTYITGGIIGSNIDENCIVLDNTKCEKFVVNKILFCSTGPNIKLIPAVDSLIEGSYIFNGCLFTGMPFDDINNKYQTSVTFETGFCMMYDNNTKHYSRSTSTGTIESDLIVYKNVSNQISEKLTPSSAELDLKSSKRLVYLDNFDGSVPPNLKTERLYADVWVKKSSDWNNNSSPCLMVAANPTLSIFEDTIIDTHNTNTTSWVILSSTNPIAVAADVRGVVELYISCRGNSGGSINIDDWNVTII